MAVSFLSTTVVAVGAATVSGGRWTAAAVARQEAVRLGSAILDSVTAAGAGAGEVVRDPFRVRWSASGGSAVRLEVAPATGGDPLVVLEGTTVPDVPVLPDRGDTTSAAVAAWPG